MSQECSHNCSECGNDCEERTEPQSLLEHTNEASDVKKVIGVVSGKGGVGKSLVTSLLASAMQKKGYAAAVLDADITGPSIQKMFGIHQKAVGNPMGIVENMSYFECPTCHDKHYIFGNSHIEKMAKEYGIQNTARIPVLLQMAAASDSGDIESVKGDWLDEIVMAITEA